MLGGIIGGALKGIGSIFGGISASAAAKKAKQNVKSQMVDNENWFNRRYNEDATQRADAQRMLTMTQDALRRGTEAAAGSQAVTGGTDESVAAAKASASKTMADATSQVAADAANRKDAVESQYISNKAALNKQLNDIEMGKAQAVTGAIQGLGDAAASIGSVAVKAP